MKEYDSFFEKEKDRFVIFVVPKFDNVPKLSNNPAGKCGVNTKKVSV